MKEYVIFTDAERQPMIREVVGSLFDREDDGLVWIKATRSEWKEVRRRLKLLDR